MRQSIVHAALIVGLMVAATAPAHCREEKAREYIYGAELMSEPERERYRESLRIAPTDQSAANERDAHRRRLQERARQRGVRFDDSGVVRKP